MAFRNNVSSIMQQLAQRRRGSQAPQRPGAISPTPQRPPVNFGGGMPQAPMPIAPQMPPNMPQMPILQSAAPKPMAPQAPMVNPMAGTEPPMQPMAGQSPLINSLQQLLLRRKMPMGGIGGDTKPMPDNDGANIV